MTGRILTGIGVGIATDDSRLVIAYMICIVLFKKDYVMYYVMYHVHNMFYVDV